MSWPVIVAIVVVADLLLNGLLVWGLVRAGWGPLTRAYPPREAMEGAVTRTFQSFRVRWLNLGLCIHVTADEHHLHLVPARFLRWFGAGPVSVPWRAITVTHRTPRRATVAATFDALPVRGPAWCLDLADGGAPGTSESSGPANAPPPATH
jgi:hypothetical protein